MLKMKYPLFLFALTIFTFIAIGCDDDEAGINNIALEPISSQVEADLLQLREEEKLARDVYLTLYDKWEIEIFKNISNSEQSHMDKVKVLLDAYEIADPVSDNTIGVFKNETLATLYNELIEFGMISAENALMVGGTVEDLDIFDIREMRVNTDNAMVIGVYDLLECGSNNHMRSFTSELTTINSVYLPQFISAEDYASILATTRERCGRN